MDNNSRWEIEISLWDFIDNLNSDSIDFLTVDLNDRDVIERIVQSVCVWDLSILDINADVLQFQLIEIQKVMRQECEDSKELFEGIREREKKRDLLKMRERKLALTCADTNGIDEDIISKAMSVENLLIASGESSHGYTRIELLKLAIEMKKTEILGDLEEDLSVIRESLRKEDKTNQKTNDLTQSTELKEETVERIEGMLYEGIGLDEQINNLLDDLEEFYKTELGIDKKKFKNGRYIN